MKAYTDLSQSKKLAEILPIESADMYWFNRHIDLTENKYEAFIIDKSNKYIDFFKSYAVAINNKEIIPCWSLATLLNILAKQDFMIKSSNTNNECLYNINIPSRHCKAWSPSLVDAAFEIVCWLKKNGK